MLSFYRVSQKTHFLNCRFAKPGLRVDDHIPSNPVSQNGNSESVFLGHSEICVIITWHGLGSG